MKQDLFSASFPTDQQGWACGRWGTVLHTADGGKSWVEQKSPVDYFLMGVCFINSKKGWVATEWTTILYTEDGGKNWQVQFKGDDYILKAVSFCDPLNGWVAGEYGYIYHTSDGGHTWTHQAGSFAFSEEAFELVGENTLFNVHAVDPKRAWVVGIDGYIAGTLDGGATWEKVETGIPMTQLFAVCSDSQGRVICIGGESILITSSDAGKGFGIAKAAPPVTYGWIYGIARRGSKGFVAVGKEGWIYLSDTKGMFWKQARVGGGNLGLAQE